MGRQDLPESRKPFKSGDSIAVTVPKEALREEGLLDEDDQLVDGATARPFIDEDEGEVGAAVTRDD